MTGIFLVDLTWTGEGLRAMCSDETLARIMLASAQGMVHFMQHMTEEQIDQLEVDATAVFDHAPFTVKVRIEEDGDETSISFTTPEDLDLRLEVVLAFIGMHAMAAFERAEDAEGGGQPE